MAELRVCEHCNEGATAQDVSEHKEEELGCHFCAPNAQTAAECLFKGKPCCVQCRESMKSKTRSPAGSIRSDQRSLVARSDKQSLYKLNSHEQSPATMDTSRSQTLLRTQLSHHPVTSEFFKANAFFQRYLHDPSLPPLFDSRKDGLSAQQFHRKCEDSKGGLVVLLKLSVGVDLVGFSWKGIRRGCTEMSDVQAGGAIVRGQQVDFQTLDDNWVLNLPEGISFARSKSLYINFDDMRRSECRFCGELVRYPSWSSLVQCILAYKLQV